VKLNDLGRELSPRALDCSLRVYEVAELVDREYEVIGDIYIHDTGFTVSRCGKQDVRARVRREACQMGADGVEIYRESHPDWLSTCYRVKARFLRFTDGAGS
jgi:hypothetical protein